MAKITIEMDENQRCLFVHLNGYYLPKNKIEYIKQHHHVTTRWTHHNGDWFFQVYLADCDKRTTRDLALDIGTEVNTDNISYVFFKEKKEDARMYYMSQNYTSSELKDFVAFGKDENDDSIHWERIYSEDGNALGLRESEYTEKDL